MDTTLTMLLFSGAGIGLAIVASPGAVTAQVIRRGLHQGFNAAFILQLGALIGLAIWAVVAFIGVALVAQNAVIQLMLGVMGSGLLLYLGWDALKASIQVTQTESSESANRGDFALGLALSLANPLPLAFWLGLGNNITSAMHESTGLEPFAMFLIGFLTSALIFGILLAALLAWGKQFVTPGFFRSINFISGLLLGFFALKLLSDTLNLVAR